MKYTSTRNFSEEFTASEAIARGLAPDGGLFVPRELPGLSALELSALLGASYPERAASVLKIFLDGFGDEEILRYCHTAYKSFNFDVAPIRNAGGELFLELWHGPTCAFKDVALQLLPHLLSAALEKTGQSETALILTATSGDTGKAALEGFRDVENTEIVVFFPENGVSDMQKLQMATQLGDNLRVVAVRGNFDDAQSGVKRMLGDPALGREVASRGRRFSSANSINWGRLAPQIAYYLSAYLDCVANCEIKFGEELNFCLPTGNFGNILAAYYAKRLGVPIGKLICASNENNVLTDFLRIGRYDRRRALKTTYSPSMDILVSSNVERLLLHMTGDPVKVSTFMSGLREDDYFELDDSTMQKIFELFYADYCDDSETLETISCVWNESQYLLDPHTAVAECVKQKYLTATGDPRKTVVVSTANPYKFCGAVLSALDRREVRGGVELVDELERRTGVTPPPQLSALRSAKIRFTDSCSPDEMPQTVLNFLNR